MKILQLKMKIIPLKNDDFGATRSQVGAITGGQRVKPPNYDDNFIAATRSSV